MKKFQITFKGQVYEFDVEEISSSTPVVAKTVSAQSPAPVIAPTPTKGVSSTPAGAQIVPAPMPGKIMEIKVKLGDSIKRGDIICILEAMKMQNEIMATQDGTVSEVRVMIGQTVVAGDVIIATS